MTVYVSPEKYPFYLHKGRLCQHSSYFKKAFYGPFKEAIIESMYLEEDGVDEFKLFEEWLYSERLSYPKDSDNLSLLLVKVFCFAEKVGISALQNATLDAIRDRATEQDVPLPPPDITYTTYAKPKPFSWSFDPPQDQTMTSPGLEKPVAKYLSPATSSAIRYAYQYTPQHSPLRKLLADIFAYNVKPETLDEDILSFPHEFMADVLLVNMKRLPLRLKEEEADFDKNADKYHIHDSSSTPNDSRDEPVAEATISEPAPPCEAPDPELTPDLPTVIDEDGWGFSGPSKSSSGKGKKRGTKRDV